MVMFSFGFIGSLTDLLPTHLPVHIQKSSMLEPADTNPYGGICQLDVIESYHPLPGCSDHLVDRNIDLIFL